MKPQNDETANKRLFLMLCCILGFMSFLVLVAGRGLASNLVALIIFWALLFGMRYLARIIPVAYHYFRGLHQLHQHWDTPPVDKQAGNGLTAEEEAEFQALTRRLKP